MKPTTSFLFTLSLVAIATCVGCRVGAMTAPLVDPAESTRPDRWQIAELTARFADAVNRHDWQTVAQLCAEDAVWETSAGKLGFRYQGRAAILEFLLENPNGVEVLAYTTTTPFIETMSSNRARTRLNMTEYLRVRATGEIKQIVGVYSDELVKRDGRWQFAHRSFSMRVAFDEKPAAL